jgi:predicted pyridoxine 5'-phosphate oxidase superfamily flavin-nucleotide-binding protein
MGGVFHSGELEVQERLGVRGQASKIGSGIRAEISPERYGFLLERRFVVVASLDRAGAVWASLLSGAPGFLEPVDARRLRVHARPLDGDPLAEGLTDGADVGLLAIDLANRKRLRLNGRVGMRDDGFDVVTREVFGNCPKYIQSRVPTADGADVVAAAPVATSATHLDERQRQWVGEADTFFVASRHAEAGADASHRGGNPGFMRVVDAARLAWPDYSGNRMFQTLGNLARDGRAGLLFIDFDAGRTLQLAGRARVDWDEERARGFAGAERVIDFVIDRVVEIAGRAELRHRLLARSPFNPE